MTNEGIGPDEIQRRKQITALPLRVVVVEVLATKIITGLEKRRRDEQATAARRTPDREGFAVFERIPGVRISRTLEELSRRGFRLTDAHYEETLKDKRQYFTFTATGNPIEQTPEIADLLNRRFRNGSLHINPATDEADGSRYRVDVFGLAKGEISYDCAHEVMLEEDSYRTERS